MKKQFAFKLFASIFALFLSTSSYGSSMVAHVKLSPAGGFQAKTTKITGKAQKIPGGFVAKNITADFTKLKTGVSLRDSHAKNKYLKVKEYPTAKLIKAKGKNGKGIAVMEIMGKQHKFKGTYTIKKSKLTAKFDLLLSQIGITGIKYMGVGVKDKVAVEVVLPIE